MDSQGLTLGDVTAREAAGDAPQPRCGRGIPDATVARLPVYLRALHSARRGRHRHRLLRRARHGRRRQLGQGAQGPVLPRLVRHPGRRLRRRLPGPPDLARARPDPALGGRHRRHRQPRARPRAVRRLRHPRLPGRRADRRRPRAGSGEWVDGVAVSARRRHGRGGPRARGVDRRHRDSGRRRPGRLRPAGRGRRHEHPQLRPDRADRARRASTCARSTCPSSCRSSPSTSSARPARPALRLPAVEAVGS